MQLGMGIKDGYLDILLIFYKFSYTQILYLSIGLYSYIYLYLTSLINISLYNDILISKHLNRKKDISII